jgi:serine/threonine protein kinase
MGITHKNIKPDNVTFRYGFGNAKQLEIVMVGAQLNSQELQFKRYGEPGFIAPEIMKIEEGSQSAEKYYTEACDIFSLGCIFHYL